MTDGAPKKDGHGYDIAKMLGIVVTIGTIIFGAGAANEKLKTIDANQKAADEQKAHRTRLEDDRYEKLRSAVDGLSAKVEDQTEEIKRLRWSRRGRREAAPPAVDLRP